MLIKSKKLLSFHKQNNKCNANYLKINKILMNKFKKILISTNKILLLWKKSFLFYNSRYHFTKRTIPTFMCKMIKIYIFNKYINSFVMFRIIYNNKIYLMKFILIMNYKSLIVKKISILS